MAVGLSSTFTLNDGVVMPRFGLGVYRMYEGSERKEPDPIVFALKHGYRLLDTAHFYDNQSLVGEAVRNSGVPREDIFVVTKLWGDQHGEVEATKAVEKSLKELDICYIDMYMIHSPRGDNVVETYKTLLKFKEKELIRSVAVSNFGVQHLEGLKAAGLPAPSVNQIELHPWQNQRKAPIIEYCIKNNIAVMGYSPLVKFQKPEDPTAVEIGNRYNKTWAQVLIRWCVQRGFITIPKSSNPKRIVENADIFDFNLSDADMTTLNDLPDFGCTWDPTQDPWVN